MKTFSKLAVAAALAVTGFTAIPAMAEAQQGARGGYGHDYGYGRHGDRVRGDRNYGYSDNRYQQGYGYRGWSRPEGYFTVRVNLCPDLIEDRFDSRYTRGRGDRREDWRDRQVIECPDRAWDYVPSAREARMGRTGDRLRPSVAYLDRRTGTYLAETRWGAVPVQVIGGRPYGYDRGRGRGRGRGNGVSFHLQIN